MGDPSQGRPSFEIPPPDRLDSWKEIAAHLRRDVTTVQRWEKRGGMPVHRHVHDKAGSVYAFSAELDAWAGSRKLRAIQESGTEAPAPMSQGLPHTATAKLRIRWRIVLPVTALAVALAAGAGLWFKRNEYFWKSPIMDAQIQTVTDFEGVEPGAAVSRDGHFAAFLSNRDGPMDVWVTQIGSGQFHNLIKGSAPEL